MERWSKCIHLATARMSLGFDRPATWDVDRMAIGGRPKVLIVMLRDARSDIDVGRARRGPQRKVAKRRTLLHFSHTSKVPGEAWSFTGGV